MNCSAAPRSTQKHSNEDLVGESHRRRISQGISRRRIIPVLFFTGALCFAGQPALAQHGGGGHASSGGGSGHASSSAHFGGSGHISASQSSSSSHSSGSKSVGVAAEAKPVASAANGRGYSSASRASGSAGISVGAGLRSTPTTNDSPRAGTLYSSVPRNVTIGFPPRGIPIAPATASAASIVRGSRVSFFGDGGAVWEEASRAPATHGRASILTAGGPTPGKPLFGTPIEGGRILPRRPRRPIFGGFGGNHGFGFLFFDFGLGLNAWDACDPTWAFGCNAFADRYSGYDWFASAGSYPVDASIGMQSSDEPIAGNWLEPPEDSLEPPPNTADEIAAEKSLTVLFLNDGSVYAVTNYWLADGKLHYETSYGGDNSIDLGALDLQRTVNANAARGMDFTLRPAPASPPTSAPERPDVPPPNAQPDQQPQPAPQPN